MHHIIIQGIERRQIFKNDQDRDNLIDRLSILLPETQTACYACVFMPNHAPFSSRGSMAVLAVLFAACYKGV
ncbi:MAG: hypothetical protein ACWGNI_09240 [Desulfobacterales bacterium]